MFSPERLAWIRKKRGLNKSNLAVSLGVDLRSISGYESGEYVPSSDNINKLANLLNVDSKFFFLGDLPGPSSDQVSFRSFSKLSAAKRDMALGSAAIAFALYEWLSKRFELPEPAIPEMRDAGSPEEAATELRYMWGLGEKPISNIVHLLESKGVRIYSLALDIADVDACCTWHNSVPFIFLNTKKSNARRRFDAAHELGHLVLHRHGVFGGKDIEREADEFASAFLMPRDGIRSTAPRLPNLANVIPNKSRWGVSVGAYVVRLHRLKLISDWHYRTLYKQISHRGFRKSEPHDHVPETSKLSELILQELRSDGMSIADVADEIGVSLQDISDLLFGIAIIGIDGSKNSAKVEKSRSHIRVAVDNTRRNGAID